MIFDDDTSLYEKLSEMSENAFCLQSDTYTFDLRFKLGSPAVFGSAAYWIYQGTIEERNIPPSTRTLEQEVLYCMLGGYGISGELSNAYYDKIINQSENRKLEQEFLLEMLLSPVSLNGKMIRYRYPKMKSEQIALALSHIRKDISLPITDAKKLRDKVMKAPGIGYKTASWIVRNQLASNEVAILDIHIHRAGVLAGFFDCSWCPAKNYLEMEEAYIRFSNMFDLSASSLDLVIWNHMRMRQIKNPNRILKKKKSA